MSMCKVFSCVVRRGCLLWPVLSLGKTLLAFALLHFVLQGQTWLLLQVFLGFLLLQSSPLWWNFSSVQSHSHVWLFVTPWNAPCQASLSITNFGSLLKLMSIELVMPSNHLTLCHPRLLPSIFPSIRVFSNESVLRIRWSKYWSFSFSISPANEYSGLIFFKMDWLNLLAVQGTGKSLLQHYSSKAQILRCSAFVFEYVRVIYLEVILLLLLLSCFSHIRLCETLWTVARQLLCPQDYPGKSTGVGCHALLQGIFPTQGLNSGLLHCRQTVYHWATGDALRWYYPNVIIG